MAVAVATREPEAEAPEALWDPLTATEPEPLALGQLLPLELRLPAEPLGAADTETLLLEEAPGGRV